MRDLVAKEALRTIHMSPIHVTITKKPVTSSTLVRSYIGSQLELPM